MKILFVVAHPDLPGSRANRKIVEQVKSVEHLHIHDLYARYPDFHIPRKKEQQLLQGYDLLVWQHPLLWYGLPPLLKLWIDEVLEQGFAFGNGGDKLRGKKILVSVTTGGPKSSYQKGGANLGSMDEFLLPQRATAHLCGMEWLEPKIFHHARRASELELNDFADELKEQLSAFSKQ